MKFVKLTQKQYAKMEEDDNKVQMLSNEEVEKIATYVNGAINIPFRNEEKEQVIFFKAVRKIDKFIYSKLPTDIYELVKSTLDGISPEESELICDRLASVINKFVNLPYLVSP